MIKTAITVLFLTAISLYGTTIYWEGEVDNLYTNAANWSTGTVPANNDYSDLVYFQDDKLSGDMNKNCHLDSNRKVSRIYYIDSGYEFTGSQITLKALNCLAESGTNKIANVKSATYDLPVIVSTNGTLYVTSELLMDSKNLSVNRGGTLICKKLRNYNTSQTLSIDEGAKVILLQNNVWYGSTSGTVTIKDETSEYQYQSTVAGAEAKIAAGKITTTLTDRELMVTDVGGGYVSVTITPLPENDPTVFLIN